MLLFNLTSNRRHLIVITPWLQGAVSLVDTLDREKRPLGYSIEVTATNILDLDNPLSRSTEAIHINLLDINDNQPQFTNIPDGPFSVDEDKKSRSDSEVLQVQAIDPDMGLNGTVEFYLTADRNTTGLCKMVVFVSDFRIDSFVIIHLHI